MSQSVHESQHRVETSANLKATLQRAGEYAAQRNHRLVTIEHILLALNEDPEAKMMLKACAIDQGRLNNDISSYLNFLQDNVAAQENIQHGLHPEAARIINSAVVAAQKSRRKEVNGAIVLAAIIGDGKTRAAKLLSSQGLTFEVAIKALQMAQSNTPPPDNAHTLRQPSLTQPLPSGQMPPTRAVNQRPADASKNPTSSYSTAEVGKANTNRDIPNQSDPPSSSSFKTLSSPKQPREEEQRITTEQRRTPPSQSASTQPANGPKDFAAKQSQIVDSLARFERRPPPPLQQYSPQSQSGSPSAPKPKSPSPPPLPPTATHAPAQSSGDRLAPHQPPEKPPSPRPQRFYRDPLRRPPPPKETSQRPPRAAQSPSDGYDKPPPHPQQQGRSLPPYPPVSSAPDPYTAGQFDHYNQTTPTHDPQDEGVHGYQYPQHSPPPENKNLPALVPGEESRSARVIRSGQLMENIPRRMRVGVMQSVEVRIARTEIQNLTEDMRSDGAGQRRDFVITRVMAMRLRAPDSAFFIEPASPETQWIENHLGILGDEFASWRWTITPKQAGRATFQLIVSARTIGGDGITAEIALPDQLYDIRVSKNYRFMLKLSFGLAAAAIVGGFLATFSEDILNIIQVIIRNGTGGGSY